MHTKTRLVLIFSAFFITMCRSYSDMEPANPIEELSCRAFNNFGGSKGVECYYACPDGTVGPLIFENDPSRSATKGDLDRLFCDIAPQPTFTAPPTVSPSPTSSPTILPSATVVVPVTAQDPLLAETVSMCDLGGKLINFRIVEPAPEFTEQTLEVQIAGQESTCYVNPTNPSLLTCSIPNDISFPIHVVVSLDGVVVNDFDYSGLGCAILTTPTPFKKARSYP
jgi:hypothetical protein